MTGSSVWDNSVHLHIIFTLTVLVLHLHCLTFLDIHWTSLGCGSSRSKQIRTFLCACTTYLLNYNKRSHNIHWLPYALLLVDVPLFWSHFFPNVCVRSASNLKGQLQWQPLPWCKPTAVTKSFPVDATKRTAEPDQVPSASPQTNVSLWLGLKNSHSNGQ